MPYPRWLAKVAKHVFNPRVLRKGKQPVVVHVGRSSSTTYRTPLDAHPTRTGFVLVVRYGPESDWVRNIVAAGRARLVVDGQEHLLASPRVVAQQEAIDELPPGFDPGKDFYRAEHYLVMDHSS
jgi:deazaflavin-dependent oxidoreductase (nitroreductase family)